jgi:membrane protease YdiL (CAAX protease family)
VDEAVPAPVPPSGFPNGGRLGPGWGYAIGVAATVLVILSQYVIPYGRFFRHISQSPIFLEFVGSGLVYGIPILVFAALVGARPLSRFVARSGRAALESFRWYGLLSLLAIAVGIALVILYTVFDPSALGLLNKPNPALEGASSDPWFYVGFSFLVGFAEETIFRGWIFGYWLARGTSRWALHAVWTSFLFAGVHVYYALTYGPVAPISFATLFLLGFAFAAAVRYSGGNLLLVSLLHGLNDATAYLGIVSQSAALALHYGVILIGVIIAIVLVVRGRARAAPEPWPVSPYAWTAPPGGWPSGATVGWYDPRLPPPPAPAPPPAPPLSDPPPPPPASTRPGP